MRPSLDTTIRLHSNDNVVVARAEFSPGCRIEAEQVTTDDVGCGWVDLHLAVSVDGEVATGCTARVALPKDKDDNPWKRKGDQWKP